MKKPECILVRVGEIALKSPQVQKKMFNILLDNIKSALKGKYKIEINPNRIFIYTKQIDKNIDVLKSIFGITSVSPCWTCFSGLNEIKLLASDIATDVLKLSKRDSFAIRVRRSGIHKFTSQTIAEEVGAGVKRITNAKVDLTKGKEIFIECRSRKTYIFLEKILGLGGMPLGTAGKVVVLLSGGIDSPVAAWLMMKRGCELVLLYGNNSPYTDETTFKRTEHVAKVLKEWHKGKEIEFYRFKHGKNLKEFIEKVPRKLTCVFCKRMMYRIANKIAEKEEAHAVVTGESLAQVASQTLINLKVLDEASVLPVLRPLITYDKQETTELAKGIGTYEKSIMKVKSCEAVPSRPITKADLRFVKRMEDKIDIEKLLKESLKSLKEVKI